MENSENRSKLIGIDYDNHDDFIKDLKLKTDTESKKALQSYKNMWKAWCVDFIIFGAFIIAELLQESQNLIMNDTYYMIWVILIVIPMLTSTILGRGYKAYIYKNNIKILEEALYYYSK